MYSNTEEHHLLFCTSGQGVALSPGLQKQQGGEIKLRLSHSSELPPQSGHVFVSAVPVVRGAPRSAAMFLPTCRNLRGFEGLLRPSCKRAAGALRLVALIKCGVGVRGDRFNLKHLVSVVRKMTRSLLKISSL